MTFQLNFPPYSQRLYNITVKILLDCTKTWSHINWSDCKERIDLLLPALTAMAQTLSLFISKANAQTSLKMKALLKPQHYAFSIRGRDMMVINVICDRIWIARGLAALLEAKKKSDCAWITPCSFIHIGALIIWFLFILTIVVCYIEGPIQLI